MASDYKSNKKITFQNVKNNLKTLILPAIVGLVLMFLIGGIQVHGISMENTLHDGQYLIMQKMVPKYQAGDIVVANIVRYDTGLKECIIKRIIATEGQTVEIIDGALYVNGEAKDEKYIKETMVKQSFEKIVVPEGEVYVMGDNRNDSFDSRYQGTIKISDLQGKILFVK